MAALRNLATSQAKRDFSQTREPSRKGKAHAAQAASSPVPRLLQKSAAWQDYGNSAVPLAAVLRRLGS